MKRKHYVRVGSLLVEAKLPKELEIYQFKDGQYVFWTAMFKAQVDGKRKIYGRARVGLSAGDRFDRMNDERTADYIPKNDQLVYDYMWCSQLNYGHNIKHIRPSDLVEINNWFDTHPKQRRQLVIGE